MCPEGNAWATRVGDQTWSQGSGSVRRGSEGQIRVGMRRGYAGPGTHVQPEAGEGGLWVDLRGSVCLECGGDRRLAAVRDQIWGHDGNFGFYPADGSTDFTMLSL